MRRGTAVPSLAPHAPPSRFSSPLLLILLRSFVICSQTAFIFVICFQPVWIRPPPFVIRLSRRGSIDSSFAGVRFVSIVYLGHQVQIRAGAPRRHNFLDGKLQRNTTARLQGTLTASGGRPLRHGFLDVRVAADLDGKAAGSHYQARPLPPRRGQAVHRPRHQPVPSPDGGSRNESDGSRRRVTQLPAATNVTIAAVLGGRRYTPPLCNYGSSAAGSQDRRYRNGCCEGVSTSAHTMKFREQNENKKNSTADGVLTIDASEWRTVYRSTSMSIRNSPRKRYQRCTMISSMAEQRMSLPGEYCRIWKNSVLFTSSIIQNVNKKLRPRVLVDVSKIDMSTSLLGYDLPSPIIVAPTGHQKIANPEGEVATARAAAACNTIMIYKRRDVSATLVRRAESLGFKAIVLTVDAPDNRATTEGKP
ncbi:hypothetical protein EJB05_11329, partial [Eragrostis curvula]